MYKDDKTPGPNHYSFISFIGKNRTMAVMKSSHFTRGSKQSLTVTPGVGTYDIRKSTDFVRPSIPAIRIGNSARNSLDEESKKGSPGPASYNIDDKLINIMKNNSPRPFIGTSTREILNRTINWPGPASYRNTNNFSSNKEMYQKITIRGRSSPKN